MNRRQPAKWEPAAEIPSVLCEGSGERHLDVAFERRAFKDPESDLSQLNRLGRAYFHLCLLSDFSRLTRPSSARKLQANFQLLLRF